MAIMDMSMSPAFPAKGLVKLAWLMAGLSLLPLTVFAQDEVWLLPAKGDGPAVKRQIEITDFTGENLSILTLTGKIEAVPTSRVERLQYPLSPSHQSGNELIASGQTKEAITAWRSAKRDEMRPWVVRELMAQLVTGHLELAEVDRAGEEFLALVASDPTTRSWQVAPLAWRGRELDPLLEARASQWLKKGDSPAAQLLGASWLLGSPQRSEALLTLEKLLADRKVTDRRLAALAEIQLWRTKLVTAKVEEIAGWQRIVEQLPAEIRPTGYFFVAEAWARTNQPERASLAYMQLPLVFGSHRALAAEGLLGAAKQLEKLGRPPQAAELYAELIAKYPQSPLAAEAATRQTKLSPAPAAR